jgi:hypothetical protein
MPSCLVKPPHFVQVEFSLHLPEQSAIVTTLSLMNPVHMLPEEGVRALRASKYNGRHIKSIWLLIIKLVYWISVYFTE